MGILSALLPAGVSTPASLLLIIRAVVNFVGYLMIWLTVTGKVDKPDLWKMCIYFYFVANLQNSANTGVLETCQTNFPQRRTLVRVLLKGFLGLSVGILTQIDFALYSDDDRKSLILLLAWLPAVICVLFVYMIRTSDQAVVQQNDAKTVLYKFLYVFIALTFFLTAMEVAQKLITFSQAAYSLSGAAVVFSLLLLFAIVLKEDDPESSSNNLKPSLNNLCTYCSTRNIAARQEYYTILKSIFSVNMMILLIAVVCGIGVGSTAIDNLGQIVESLQYPTKSVKISVSMVSFWIYIGRIAADTVSEKFITKYKSQRLYVAAAVLIHSSVGYLLIAFPVSYALYIAPVIIGFSQGFQLGLLKPIIGDIFGPANQVNLFNLARLGGPLGSYIFNVSVVGRLYDREALKTRARADISVMTCIGQNCFKTAFFILSIASAFGGLPLILLGIRMKEEDLNEGCTCNQKEDEEMKIIQVFHALDDCKTEIRIFTAEDEGKIGKGED